MLGLLLTSMLAGTATLPIAAYHFGRVQFYFALSNLVAVPLTGVLVMPAGMLSLALMPFGIEWPALIVMGWGNEAVLWIARFAAALPGATLLAPHMPPWGLATVALGLVWLGLWRSRLRLAGVAIIALGIASPAFFRPPDLLVSAEARLIAVRMPGGVFLQQVSGGLEVHPRFLAALLGGGHVPSDSRAGNAARRHDRLRDRELPAAALARRQGCNAGAWRGPHPDGCGEVSVIVSAEPARGLCPRPWPALVDRFTVWRNGATAIWLNGSHAYVLTDRAYRGDRPWVPPPPTPHAHAAPTLPLSFRRRP